jgi:hypothetical protein
MDVIARRQGRCLVIGLLLVVIGMPIGATAPAADRAVAGPDRAVPFLETREPPPRIGRTLGPAERLGVRGRAVKRHHRVHRSPRHRHRAGHRGKRRQRRGVDQRRQPVAAGRPYLYHVGRITPADLWHAYGEPYATAGSIPAPGPQSPVVAVIASGSYANRVYRDLAVFRQRYGLPACPRDSCFVEINEAGATSPLPPVDTSADWGSEADADVQAISATCPECRIVLADATPAHGDAGLVAAARAALGWGARYVSMSFGWGDPGPADAVPGAAALFATPGVLFAAATGDGGYAGSTQPAGSAGVVAVGGLTLTPSADRRTETFAAWSRGGSGCSSSSSASPGQLTSPAALAACGGGKAESDISAPADPATGLLAYVQGTWALVGGTSVATPLVVGLYAAARNHTDPWVIYASAARPGLVRDVTAGRTGSCPITLLCQATPGWDAPTGVGTPATLAALQARKPPQPG